MNIPAMSERTRETLIVVAVALVSCMAGLDISIVNVALPSLSRHFDASTSMVSWVIIAYLLVLTGCLLLFGRIGDVRGYRGIFLSGCCIFAAGSFLCAIAGSIGELIIFRIIQAGGGAMFSSVGPAIVSRQLSDTRKGWGLGMAATFTSLGIVLGPPLGGAITSLLGWRWIFFITIPFAVAAAVIGSLVIRSHSRPGKKIGFDIPGVVLLLIGLSALICGLNLGNEYGWTSLPVGGLFTTAFISGAAFYAWERRAEAPVLDLTLFSNHSFTLANASFFLIRMAFTGTIFLFPFYFELVQGYSAHTVGLLLTVPAVFSVLTAPIAGKLSGGTGSRTLCTAGAFLGAVAFGLFTAFTAEMGLFLIILALALRGISAGLYLAPNRYLIFKHSPEEKHGVVSSFMKTVGNSGSAFGVAIFETIFAELILAGSVAGVGAFHETVHIARAAQGFEAIFLIATGLCLITLILTVFTREPVKSD